MPRFSVAEIEVFGEIGYLTRTGYTGEDGVEIISPANIIEKIWDFFIKEGKGVGLVPAGLGVRDVLRLEAGYLLYGSDVDEEHNSYEAGFGWVVRLEKESDFVAKHILTKVKEQGVKRKLTKFQLFDLGVPREGNAVYKDGQKIGALTSGSYSPIFKGIGMGYVDHILEEGTEVEIESGTRKMSAKVVKNFYKNKI
jgi:aminomethyltransferase